MNRPNFRTTFGWIFLFTCLAVFYVLASNSIARELNDVYKGPPLTEPARKAMPAGVNKAVRNYVLPWEKVSDMPHMKAMDGVYGGQTTNDNPFLQFSVVMWLGWAFVIAALADVCTAYLTRTKVRVEE